MELTRARSVLGVSATDDWSVVRGAYREQIRRSHPDVAGGEGVERTIELNAAYRALALARREGRLHETATTTVAPGPTTPDRPEAADDPLVAVRREWSTPPGPPPDARFVDHDTIALSSTPEHAFRRLVDAAHEIGDLSYLDRSSAIFEAIVALDDGTHASLVVSLQWRAHDATTEAFCTLEALNRPAQLDVGGVLRQLLLFLPPDPDEPHTGG